MLKPGVETPNLHSTAAPSIHTPKRVDIVRRHTSPAAEAVGAARPAEQPAEARHPYRDQQSTEAHRDPAPDWVPTPKRRRSRQDKSCVMAPIAQEQSIS